MLPTVVASVPEVDSMRSFYDFWKVADAGIWPGPQAGQTETLGFMHIAFFAWICNLAMHVGLSDMALFRYARRASYGFYSAFGMYLGHYLAWICAGIMGAAAALILKTPLPELDAGSVACTALGATGAVAVVIAGWTTSNPTIYRAGLALQVITPNWPRWFVTLVAGVLTTIVACSPFVFTKLLDFVGIYGLVLMPVGVVVFVEHWIFPRIGLTRYWVSRKGIIVNWPALLAWFASAGLGLYSAFVGGWIHLFFLVIPAWFGTAILYIILSWLWGAGEKFPPLPDERSATGAADSASAHSGPLLPESKGSSLYYLSGLVAVASLVFCLGCSIWTASADEGAYDARL